MRCLQVSTTPLLTTVNSLICRAGKILLRLVGLPDNDYRVTAEVRAAVAKAQSGGLDQRHRRGAPGTPQAATDLGSFRRRMGPTCCERAAENVDRSSPRITQDNEMMAIAVHPAPTSAKTTDTPASTTAAVTVAASGGHALAIAGVVIGGIVVSIIAVVRKRFRMPDRPSV